MCITQSTKTFVFVTALFALTACGSDDPAPADTTNTEENSEIDPAGDTNTGDDSLTQDNTGSDNSNPTAAFGPAQYIISECGSVPVSTTIANSSRTAPALLNVGEVVRGQLVPGTTENGFHVWQITLTPGNYHVVADAFTVQEGISGIGLELYTLGATESDDVKLAGDAESAYDLRLYDFLEIRDTQTVNIKIQSINDTIHNYTMGVFANGTAVPSPTFERCLPIEVLALDSTVAVPLDASVDREDDRWYSVELEDQEYKLDASTRSAETQALGYVFDLFTQFGQTETLRRITTDSLTGTELVTSDTFDSNSDNGAWIRVRNFLDQDNEIEFTLSTP